MDYDRDHVRAFLKRLGLNPDQAPYALERKTQIASLTLMPVVEVKPTLDAFERLSSQPTRVIEPERIVYTYSAVAKSVETIRSERLDELEHVHDRYEAGFVMHRDCLLVFDLKARVNAAGLVKGFEEGTITQTDWRAKQADGEWDEDSSVDASVLKKVRIPIDSIDEARDVQSAIIGAVDRGFKTKKHVESAIEAADEATLRDFSVSTEFNDYLTTLTGE